MTTGCGSNINIEALINRAASMEFPPVVVRTHIPSAGITISNPMAWQVTALSGCSCVLQQLSDALDAIAAQPIAMPLYNIYGNWPQPHIQN